MRLLERIRCPSTVPSPVHYMLALKRAQPHMKVRTPCAQCVSIVWSSVFTLRYRVFLWLCVFVVFFSVFLASFHLYTTLCHAQPIYSSKPSLVGSLILSLSLSFFLSVFLSLSLSHPHSLTHSLSFPSFSRTLLLYSYFSLCTWAPLSALAFVWSTQQSSSMGVSATPSRPRKRRVRLKLCGGNRGRKV